VKLRTLLFAWIAAYALGASLWGQQVTATISGRVTDPSGAAVSGAKVSATSVERGITYPATTNGRATTICRTFWLAIIT